MTEPSGGSDLQAIRTRAVRDGDDWILNGSKTFISNGNHATLALVAARTDIDARPAHGMSLFLVDTRLHAGFKKGKNLRKIGQPTYDTAELFFDNVRLPMNAVVGKLVLFHIEPIDSQESIIQVVHRVSTRASII